MLGFRTPVLEDKERIDAFVKKSGRTGCDVGFVNTFLWRDKYDIRVAFTEDSYFKCYYSEGEISGYTMPITNGDYRSAIALLLEDAAERGAAPAIGLLSDRNVGLLHRLYKDRIEVTANRDSFDYVYDRHDLATLAGKRYHSKRNHISAFYREYDDVVIEEICANNSGDVMDIAKRWSSVNGDTGELKAIREALEHYGALGLFGIIMYVSDRPVAFSIGSAINDDICDVHFEKAVDIDNAYAVINREFAKHFDSFTYLNREEDLGLEGLRKSKLSYHPSTLLTKSTAVFKR